MGIHLAQKGIFPLTPMPWPKQWCEIQSQYSSPVLPRSHLLSSRDSAPFIDPCVAREENPRVKRVFELFKVPFCALFYTGRKIYELLA